MALWKRKGKVDLTTPAGASAEQAEHAVLIHIGSLIDDVGLDSIEDPIIAAIERLGVGEFDGNVIGPDDAMLYMYGPDADRLWAAIEQEVPRALLGPGSYAVKRYGGPGAPETRIELS